VPPSGHRGRVGSQREDTRRAPGHGKSVPGARQVPRGPRLGARDTAPPRTAEGESRMRATRRSLTNAKVERIPASGIRRFFDLVSGTEGVISLGVGEPDFVTPERFREAAVRSIKDGKTKYTSSYGSRPRRDAISH